MTLSPDSAEIAAVNRLPTTMEDSKDRFVSGSTRVATPPPSERGRLEPKHNLESRSNRLLRSNARTSDSMRSTPFDIDAVDDALRRGMQRPARESTPGTSPHRKRQRINGDRFVDILFRPHLLPHSL